MENRKNIAIMIMAANMEPSTRNLEVIKNTIIKYYNDNKDRFKHNYDFYFYMCDNTIEDEIVAEKSNEYDNLTILKINDDESIYRTFEKSIKAFDYVQRVAEYDWYVRTNISMFINMDLLDAAINVLKPERIYGNAINSILNVGCAYSNDLYIRGDLMIFDKSIMTGILSTALKFMYSDLYMKCRDGVEHVDDCLLGCCYIDYAGPEYYKNLYMLSYEFKPDTDLGADYKLAKYCIGTRVKTVPPTEKYSGYSWEDNEWRQYDCSKMMQLYDLMTKAHYDYKGLMLRDILCDKSKARKTIFVTASIQGIPEVFYKFLENKRNPKK